MAATTIATIATMAMIKTTTKSSKSTIPTMKIVSRLDLSSKNLPKLDFTPSTIAPAIAGAIFSTLSTCDAAFAVQQIADIAEGGDNRGLAILLPIIPALAWVLFNILQPALNQINKMRNKGVVIGLGLGGAASGLLLAPQASAVVSEIATVAVDSGSSDNRGQLLLLVITPAIAWVLFNMLQPGLNQINKMRS